MRSSWWIVFYCGGLLGCGGGPPDRDDDDGSTLDDAQQPSGWTSVDVRDHVFDVQFIDAQRGWAGAEGEILSTADGGETWTALDVPVADHLAVWEVDFVDEQTGFIRAGEQTQAVGLFRTRDGGATWTQLPSVYGDFTHHTIYDVWASRPDVVFAAGLIDHGLNDAAHEALWRSTDGGDSWQLAIERPVEGEGYTELRAMFFVDDLHGWVVGGQNAAGTCWRTVDGGATWELLSNSIHPTGDEIDWLTGVFFLDQEEGWVTGKGGPSGNHGFVLHTTDGGTSWETQLALDADHDHWGIPEDLVFQNALTGWIVGRDFDSDALIMRTDDGGHSWTREAISGGPLVEGIRKVALAEGEPGWAAGKTLLRYFE